MNNILQSMKHIQRQSKERFILRLGIVIILVLGIGVIGNETLTVKAGEIYKLYSNSEYGFELCYPESWTVGKGAMGAIVAFSSPRENVKDEFCENCNIVVGELPPQVSEVDLDTFTEVSIGQIKQLVTNVNILSNENVTWSGKSAKHLVYTGTVGKYRLKFISRFTFRDNKVYIFTYTGNPDTYAKYYSTVMDMIDSFDLIN